MKAVIHFVLAILEGGFAGCFFYYAGKEEKKDRKMLLYMVSALWFLLSLLESAESGSEWKKMKEAKTLEVNEGDYEEGDYEDD